MKSLISLLIITGTLFGATAHAEKLTAGKAISLCRAEAIASHSDYKSSKSKRIKQLRGGFKLKLQVRLADKSITSNCAVNKSGEVTYSAN